MQGRIESYEVHCKKCDNFWIDHPSFNIACPKCSKHIKVTKLNEGLVEYLESLKIKVGKYDRKKRANNQSKISKNPTQFKGK